MPLSEHPVTGKLQICLLVIPLIAIMAGCSHRPGIVAYDHPVEPGPFRKLLDPSDYSETTTQVIQDADLKRTVQSDPAAAIRHLVGNTPEARPTNARIAASEIALKTAYRWRQANTERALGACLTSVTISQSAPLLKPSPSRQQLQAIYNEACGAFASLFHQTYGSRRNPVPIQGLDASFKVRWTPGRSDKGNPAQYDSLQPSSFIKIKGFDDRYIQNGVGGALTGYRKPTPERRSRDPYMAPAGYSFALTSIVIADKSGNVGITLHDSGENEAYLFGRRRPLTADYTAPLAKLTEMSPGSSAGFKGMLKPSNLHGGEGLYQFQPYEGKRIPLVLVHGLMSSPATWREIVTACHADPLIRKRFHIMAFYYPTGYPVPRNAALLRDSIKEFTNRHDPQNHNPNLRNIIMVGHSMGGILTNYQIRPGGKPLWDHLFTKPIEEIKMTADEREKLKSMIYFKANPDIRRAVFICSPHRGSRYASYQIGRMGSRLIKLPGRIFDDVSDSVRRATTTYGEALLKRPKNSIDNLRVNSTVLTTILEQPVTHNIPFHSIIGDRGRGDSPDSSDGVVAYWSSHLEGAASETIVAEGHNATHHPDTVRELRRILYLHLGKRLPARPSLPMATAE